MNKLTKIALVLIAAATLTTGCSTTGSSTMGSGSVNNTSEFQQHKAKILGRINERLTKIHEIQNCVEAANDSTTLLACKPHDGKKHHHHHDEN